jgi:hypothetical protein
VKAGYQFLVFTAFFERKGDNWDGLRYRIVSHGQDSGVTAAAGAKTSKSREGQPSLRRSVRLERACNPKSLGAYEPKNGVTEYL